MRGQAGNPQTGNELAYHLEKLLRRDRRHIIFRCRIHFLTLLSVSRLLAENQQIGITESSVLAGNNVPAERLDDLLRLGTLHFAIADLQGAREGNDFTSKMPFGVSPPVNSENILMVLSFLWLVSG